MTVRVVIVAAVIAVAYLLVAAGWTAAWAHGDNWRTNGYTKFHCLAHYESTHRWQYNGSHDGGLQYSPETWAAYTGASAPDYAWQASRRFQIKVARRVAFTGFRHHGPQGLSAWAAWDVCR